MFSVARLRRAEAERVARMEASLLARPEDPPDPVFKPKFDWDPDLWPEDFVNGDYGEKFWAQCPRVELPDKPKPWVSPEELRTVAVAAKFPNMKLVDKVCEMLRNGADTGVSGAARLPQEARNSPKLQLYGPRVLDTIRSWLAKNLMCGPFDPSEVKHPVKISPTGVVLKPTGAARVLQDLSYPHLENPDLDGSVPVSFNSGVDKAKFPTMSASAQDVLTRLFEVGVNAWACKIDWEDAYKVN